MNIADIERALDRIAESPFDPKEFPFDLLAAFGPPRDILRESRSDMVNPSAIGGLNIPGFIHIKTAESEPLREAVHALHRDKFPFSRFLLATDDENMIIEDGARSNFVNRPFRELASLFDFLLPLRDWPERGGNNPDDPPAGPLEAFAHEAPPHPDPNKPPLTRIPIWRFLPPFRSIAFRADHPRIAHFIESAARAGHEARSLDDGRGKRNWESLSVKERELACEKVVTTLLDSPYMGTGSSHDSKYPNHAVFSDAVVRFDKESGVTLRLADMEGHLCGAPSVRPKKTQIIPLNDALPAAA